MAVEGVTASATDWVGKVDSVVVDLLSYSFALVVSLAGTLKSV